MGKASRKKQAKGPDARAVQAQSPLRKEEARKIPAMRLSSWAAVFLVVLAGFIVYSNTFSVPFVFDDDQIAQNPMIKNLDNFVRSLKGGDFNYSDGYIYNPRRIVGYLTFALNYSLGGLNVAGYHAVNLAIHIANAILVYFLVILTLQVMGNRQSGSEKLAVSSEREEESEGAEKKSRFAIHDSLFTIHYSRLIALFSALLFVVHPIQTQAVTYIVQRFTSLATLFYLLSVVAYIKGRLGRSEKSEVSSEKSEGPGQHDSRFTIRASRSFGHSPFTSHSSLLTAFWFVLSLLSAVLAMKTKEIAFTLPLIVVLYEFTFFRSTPKKKLMFLLPVLLTLVIVPVSIVGAHRPLGEILSDLSEKTRLQTDMPRWVYLMTEIRVITTYIRLLVMPFGQNLDYDYPLYHSLLTPSVFLSFLLLLSLLGLGVYLLRKSVRSEKLELSSEKSEGTRRHDARSSDSSRFTTHYTLLTIRCHRLIGFGILWFFITLSVESSVIPIVDVIFEHRVYLPSVGAFVAIPSALLLLVVKSIGNLQKAGRIFAAVLALTVLVLSGTAVARNRVWKDTVSLWEDVAAKSPNKARAVFNLSLAYSEAKRLNDAEVLFGRVRELVADPKDHYFDFAQLCINLGKFEAARDYLNAALKVDPGSAGAYNQLCAAYIGLKEYDNAFSACTNSARLRPAFPEVHGNLSIIYRKLRRYDESVREGLQAVAGNPDSAFAHNNLGLAFVELKRFDDAEAAFRKALRLMPGYAEAYNNLGGVYMVGGRYDASIDAFQRALQADPGYLKAHFNLGVVFSLQGKRAAAMQEYAALREASPADAERLLSVINGQGIR